MVDEFSYVATVAAAVIVLVVLKSVYTSLVWKWKRLKSWNVIMKADFILKVWIVET